MTQQEALEILKMGHNVYLTGAAGSGKTFLLNEYIKFLRERGVRVGITASTGIAATHLNGVTIHSWSGLGIKDRMEPEDFDWLAKRSKLRSKIEKTGVLIIDEVSMLHSFRLDLVNEVCQFFRQNYSPFGGIQVVLCGDFFQLPPISRNNDIRHRELTTSDVINLDSDSGANFIHKSKIWNNMNLKVCYLHEQHRHNDKDLIEVLNDIRENKVGVRTFEHLNKCRPNTALRVPGESDSQGTRNAVLGENSLGVTHSKLENVSAAPATTKLYTHNFAVDNINQKHLDAIDSVAHNYIMTINKGSPIAIEGLKKSCLAPEKLSLKKGATVMFVRNSPEQIYFNGTLGTVIGFDSFGFPIVQKTDGKKVLVKEEDWNIEEDGKIKASVSQLPLRLAWAITVHKSQGMSLDEAEIDLSQSFVEGMGYVALSRVRTLAGLKLTGLNDMALKVSEEILDLDRQLKQMSELAEEKLKEMHQTEKEMAQKGFLESISPYFKDNPGIRAPGESDSQGAHISKLKLDTYDITKNLVLQKFSIKEMAEEREMTAETIINHLEKLFERGDKLDIDHLKPVDFRFDRIKEAFKKTKDKKLTPVRRILGMSYPYSEIRLARLFL